MQSVTMAGGAARAATDGASGRPLDPALPELSFVHPIPGFSDLRRFVLVRLDEQDAPDRKDGSDRQAGSTGPAGGSDPQAPGGSDRQGPGGSDRQTADGSDRQAADGSDRQAADGSDRQDGSTSGVDVLGALHESPLYELRSLEQAEVRFMVAVPGAFFADYDIELDDQECGDLGLTSSDDALVLVMLTVGQDSATTTANLLAPVVINARTREAAQVILTGSDWPVRAPLS